jgi:hypothetical protein
MRPKRGCRVACGLSGVVLIDGGKKEQEFGEKKSL